MTEGGDPCENAIAERVNGILKTEWLNAKTTATLAETTQFVRKIIGLYNHQRPHQSIGYLPPQKVHTTGIKTEKKWKNYF
jgi:transposase InsO family protein